MSNNPRFLLLDIPPQGSSAVLDSEQSAHCVRVLRKKTGDLIDLINGKGIIGKAEIVDPHPYKTLLKIVDLRIFSSRSKIHLVFGMTKTQSIDFILKKCTELGVSSFQPLITEHSLKREFFNQTRWLKLTVEACKQSQEVFFPEVFSPIDFSDWLAKRDSNMSLLVCDEGERQTNLTHWGLPVEILVGPEGGWSQFERNELKNLSNSSKLGLGKNRLRSETACLAALAIVKWNSGEIQCGV